LYIDYQIVTNTNGTLRVPLWNPGVPPKSDFAKSLFLNVLIALRIELNLIL